jgi:Ulp1 family protease
MHLESPRHWTLGIAVNLDWDVQQENGQNTSRWIVLHFDSHHCSEVPKKRAVAFARWFLDLPPKTALKLYEVPVPSQPPGSNDCGLYPAHFWKVFLHDPVQYLKLCTTVNTQPYLLVSYKDNIVQQDCADTDKDSEENHRLWWCVNKKAFRQDALQLFDYYRSISHSQRVSKK